MSDLAVLAGETTRQRRRRDALLTVAAVSAEVGGRHGAELHRAAHIIVEETSAWLPTWALAALVSLRSGEARP
jgi:hypothetical protein